MSRADCDICEKETTELHEQLAAKDAELARWQEIAIEKHALIKFIETQEEYAYSEHVILSDKELEQAATELEEAC